MWVVVVIVIIIIVVNVIRPRKNLEEAVTHFKEGNAYYQNNDYDRAIEKFTKAIRLFPTNYIDAYLFRSFAYEKKGDNDRALADLNHNVKENPNSDSYNVRGELYERMGDYDKAIKDYSNAIFREKSDENKAFRYSKRGDAYIKKGDIECGIADFEKALQIEPNHLGAKNALEEARQKLPAEQK